MPADAVLAAAALAAAALASARPAGLRACCLTVLRVLAGHADSAVPAQTVSGQEHLGHLGENRIVHMAADDRDDRRVARRRVRARSGQPPVPGRPGGGPGILHSGAVAEAAQFAERHMQLDRSRLAGPLGQHPGGDQPGECLLQRVVVTLALGALILRASLLPERVNDRGQGRGAGRGQVTVEAADAAEGAVQP